ncbi:MAG: asparaginase [Actinomycetota bacterium]|nr:asparaginase [Actinomycetota bacterium]
MRRVRLLTTGGTIASTRADDGSFVAAVSAADIAAAVGEVPGIDIRAEEVFRINSYGLTTTDSLTLAQRVLETLHDSDVDGVVVTHGTDTMEESAYLVDLLYAGPKPVVFTGAQRNAEEPDTDGPRNLRDACRLAADRRAEGVGVVIAMAGRVVAARYAAKIHTQALAAFGSTGPGQVGEVTSRSVTIGALPRHRGTFSIDDVRTPLPRVDIVPMYLGADGALVEAARRTGAAGIVLDAFGMGNANHNVVEEVARATGDGVEVLVTSRCHAGRVAPVYGAGGGVDLERAGAMFAGDLRAPKARLLLLLALASAPDASRDALVPHLDE